MAWFQNLSIRSKVMTAFASVLIVTALLGGFAVNRLSSLNDTAVALADNYLVASDALGDVAYHSMRFRQLQAAHLLATTKEAKAKEAKTMAAEIEEINKAWAVYAPTVDAGVERGMADKIMPAWNAYIATNDRFFELSNANQVAEATAYYTGEMRTANHAFADALTADQDFQLVAGQKESKLSHETYSQSRTLILAVLGIAAMLCVAMGWLIVSGVSTPIRL